MAARLAVKRMFKMSFMSIEGQASWLRGGEGYQVPRVLAARWASPYNVSPNTAAKATATRRRTPKKLHKTALT
jgi:hypothetical protein